MGGKVRGRRRKGQEREGCGLLRVSLLQSNRPPLVHVLGRGERPKSHKIKYFVSPVIGEAVGGCGESNS